MYIYMYMYIYIYIYIYMQYFFPLDDKASSICNSDMNDIIKKT